MTGSIPALNPLRMPLTGSHLIEASAGTGKTFTIAALYVRLVLGHGGEQAFNQGQALTPPDILVVTFTEAATKELRDRIRARLTEAAEYFRAAPETILPANSAHEFLADLRAGYPHADWSACAHKLQLASEWMDEAAVSTIHGWCNRMLREHAFDSRSLFNQNLETDQSELFSEAVRDYWRLHFYPLDAEAIATVVGFWTDPTSLEQAVKTLTEHVERLPATLAPQDILSQHQAQTHARLTELKQPWPQWTLELKTLLDDAKQHKQFDGRKLRSDWYDDWLNTLLVWANTPALTTPGLSESAWHRLSAEGMTEVWRDDHPPQHPAFAELSRLRQALAELPCPQQALLAHATRWIAKAFDAAQQRRAQIGFNELLTGLDRALQDDHGERLATLIRQQFPVALIDEFQDTDPVQYRIFDRIYQLTSNRPDCGLILIGDPKQAIYAFRGADIYTYLKARTAVQERLYTLDTNYRSTPAMVDAVNHCFGHVESQPDSAGAFLFRDSTGNPVPFQAMKAQGRTQTFTVLGKGIPALTAAVLESDTPLSKTTYYQDMAETCATQIVEWLTLGQQGTAGFTDENGSIVGIQPNDIAVLVNNGNEASYIRQALSRRQVRSVYLSDKESVYATPQALEVQRWLSACAAPDNDRLLRAALSTPTLGLSFAQLDELNHDEVVWEQRVIQFKTYHEIWQRQGVLPLLRSLLFDFGCIERLLAAPAETGALSGERILTDLLHLAELLQQASHSLDGEHALLRFLAEQRDAPARDNDNQKMRLESDADLVKVVTIHKSKGLEYPLVFLPFICATRQTKSSDRPLSWHDSQGEQQIALEASDEILHAADRDRLGEDIRKLYVALTRARYHTWLGLAPLKEDSVSATGHLFGTAALSADNYLPSLRAFVAAQDAMVLRTELMPTDTRFTPLTTTTRPSSPRRLSRPIQELWRISSYSGLRTASQAGEMSAPMDDTAQAANLQENIDLPAVEDQPALTPQGPLHRFPKGAAAGTFLHDLLEWSAHQGFQTVLSDPGLLTQAIQRRCQNPQWADWEDSLIDWIAAILQTPLPLPADSTGTIRRFALKELSIYQPEMEFWFETHQVELTRLDATVAAHTLAGRPRPALAKDSLNGLLKGFMDLVFEYDGRYYVADYKSNWLGHHDASYTHEQMDEAIRSHRYDLQYSLYLFALHRLLQARLPDYDYDRHIGGALYLFLRGIHADSAGVHFERPPKALMLSLDELFKGRRGGAQ